MYIALYWGSVKMSIEELVAAVQAGDLSLMEELWGAVVNLVKWKAKRVMTSLELLSDSKRVEFDDLVQSGYLALVAALETYKPECGAFSSWLMYYLQTAFADTAGYRTEQGRMENRADSLDRPLTNEQNSRPMGDFIPDHTAAATMESIEEREYREQLREALEAALEAIPEKYSRVIQLRYLQNQSLSEAGAVIGVSSERVRQMENKGLKILRQPETAANLIEFYDFSYYTGTGLGAFRQSGLTIQEKYLILEEQKKEKRERLEREERERKYREVMAALGRLP